MDQHTVSIPLRTWLVDPDYLALSQIRRRMDAILHQRISTRPIGAADAFAIGHACGSIFEAVECGLMGVVADVGDVLAAPIYAAGWRIPRELDRLLDAAAAVGTRRAVLVVLPR